MIQIKHGDKKTIYETKKDFVNAIVEKFTEEMLIKEVQDKFMFFAVDELLEEFNDLLFNEPYDELIDEKHFTTEENDKEKTIPAYINPVMLTWARREWGYDVKIAAAHLNIEPQQLVDWELGEKHLFISDLRKLAKLYRRDMGIFYLNEPPSIEEQSQSEHRLLKEEIELIHHQLSQINKNINNK